MAYIGGGTLKNGHVGYVGPSFPGMICPLHGVQYPVNW